MNEIVQIYPHDVFYTTELPKTQDDEQEEERIKTILFVFEDVWWQRNLVRQYIHKIHESKKKRVFYRLTTSKDELSYDVFLFSKYAPNTVFIPCVLDETRDLYDTKRVDEEEERKWIFPNWYSGLNGIQCEGLRRIYELHARFLLGEYTITEWISYVSERIKLPVDMVKHELIRLTEGLCPWIECTRNRTIRLLHPVHPTMSWCVPPIFGWYPRLHQLAMTYARLRYVKGMLAESIDYQTIYRNTEAEKPIHSVSLTTIGRLDFSSHIHPSVRQACIEKGKFESHQIIDTWDGAMISMPMLPDTLLKIRDMIESRNQSRLLTLGSSPSSISSFEHPFIHSSKRIDPLLGVGEETYPWFGLSKEDVASLQENIRHVSSGEEFITYLREWFGVHESLLKKHLLCLHIDVINDEDDEYTEDEEETGYPGFARKYKFIHNSSSMGLNEICSYDERECARDFVMKMFASSTKNGRFFLDVPGLDEKRNMLYKFYPPSIVETILSLPVYMLDLKQAYQSQMDEEMQDAEEEEREEPNRFLPTRKRKENEDEEEEEEQEGETSMFDVEYDDKPTHSFKYMNVREWISSIVKKNSSVQETSRPSFSL